MNKILITGANGQLGSELRLLADSYNQYVFYFTGVEKLDITKHSVIRSFIEKNKIDSIINCAAYTSVDKAETELDLTESLNHLAVDNLSFIAKEKSIQLIQISTDYVFDGTNNKPYLEEASTNPQSHYGKTKLAGELAMKKNKPENSIIIRSSWIYSSFGNNFVKSMLQYAKERKELSIVFDQIGTPTYARDLARAILDIIPKIKNKKVEVFNYSNEGICSWYDFAKAVFELSKINVKINPIETHNYPTLAKRPLYSVLNKKKIKYHYKIDIPYWRDSLKECLNLLHKQNKF